MERDQKRKCVCFCWLGRNERMRQIETLKNKRREKEGDETLPNDTGITLMHPQVTIFGTLS